MHWTIILLVLRNPNAGAVPYNNWGKKDSRESEPTQGYWPGWDSWTGAESMLALADRCPYRWQMSLKINNNLLQWLSACGTRINHHEVPWTCIKTIIPPTLDRLQFAYWHNRSTADAISYVIHLGLSHLKHKNTYVRMLFIDFSSAVNTTLPQTLISKLFTLLMP